MTGHRPQRHPLGVLGERAWLVVALLVPLVLTVGGTPGAPDTAALLVACVAALAVAASPALAPVAVRAATPARGHAAPPPPLPASRITDPVRHPLRPRAPGRV